MSIWPKIPPADARSFGLSVPTGPDAIHERPVLGEPRSMGATPMPASAEMRAPT